MKRGKVYLVGAGPGDPGLISQRGLECLAQADVVIYDRLLDERLLDSTRPGQKQYTSVRRWDNISENRMK